MQQIREVTQNNDHFRTLEVGNIPAGSAEERQLAHLWESEPGWRG
jgi:hypothetical protein